MSSAMQSQIFKTIELPKIPKNTFDLTHDVKMSGKIGELLPTLVMDCVPGDKVNLSCESLVRFAPLISPMMHRVDVYQHYFFVPYRILWENWEDFITNQTAAWPQVNVDASVTTPQERFMDYMGIPPFSQYGGGIATPISAAPFAAYQCIYNEYYRDQNLVAEVPYQLSDGINSRTNLCVLRRRAWEHDYFTASLPFAQKGAAVDLPLGEVLLDPSWAGASSPVFLDAGGSASAGPVSNTLTEVQVGGLGPNAYDPDGSLVVGSTTINDFRRAEKLQQWLELNARGGTRYIENILVHFRVRSSDKRLQRPEYITGSKSPITISEVLNTAGADNAPVQGNMAGHGVSVGRGYQGDYYCEEHGLIIGILSVMPKSAYMDGIPKFYLKSDPFDFYWPSFANIGEQEVLNNEVYPYEATGNDTFGYVPRYSEYKYMPSRVAGEFRTSLDFWHMARKFGAPPTLSQQFIECDYTEVNRVFAVNGDDDHLWMHILHQIKANRPMPIYGTPYL